MARADLAATLLDQARSLREGLEALEAPEAEAALTHLKFVRELLEAVARRAASEVSAAARGLGAPARYRRLR